MPGRAKATRLLREIFEAPCEFFFVFNGTAAIRSRGRDVRAATRSRAFPLNLVPPCLSFKAIYSLTPCYH